MTSGDRAWAGLAAYVVGYNAWAFITGRDMLSESCDRALHSRLRWPVLMTLGYLYAHLTRTLPKHLDPVRRYAHVKR